VSPVEHRSPSSQDVPSAATGCVQAPAPLQTSDVHAFASAGHAVPLASKPQWYWSVLVWMQARSQTGSLPHGLPVCTEHTPLEHVSAPLQRLPSLQGAVLYGWVH
jgi:hypothetical protein